MVGHEASLYTVLCFHCGVGEEEETETSTQSGFKKENNKSTSMLSGYKWYVEVQDLLLYFKAIPD